MATATKTHSESVNPFDHDEWYEGVPPAQETIRLQVLEDHRYGTTLPVITTKDGDQEYKPRGKPRPIAAFKAGTIADVPVDLALRLLRDFGPVRTPAERRAGRPIKFRAVDPEEAERIMAARRAQQEDRNEEVRLSRNDGGSGMPLPEE